VSARPLHSVLARSRPSVQKPARLHATGAQILIVLALRSDPGLLGEANFFRQWRARQRFLSASARPCSFGSSGRQCEAWQQLAPFFLFLHPESEAAAGLRRRRGPLPRGTTRPPLVFFSCSSSVLFPVFLFADARAAPSRVERATYVIRRRRDAAQASLLSRSYTETGTTAFRRRGRGGTAYCYSGLTRRLGRPTISQSAGEACTRPPSLQLSFDHFPRGFPVDNPATLVADASFSS